MEKRVFKTLIKKDHKFGKNVYVHGRISGMELAICGESIAPHKENENEIIYTVKCTPERYELFKVRVENHYPGLCKFDYKEGAN